jgi:nucleoside-diphosphate-sugar epimerase
VNKISIFGATGFLGTNFCNLYPDDVIKIRRTQTRPESSDVIYMISTTTNYNVYTDLHLDINTNLNVLVDVLGNLNSGDTFNFVSSWFVYGKTEPLPAKEDAVCKPFGFYSATKYCAEQLVQSYCMTFGINYRIFRLANLYGVGDKDVSAKKNALLYLISELYHTRSIGLYYNGEFIRDYIHVRDASRAIRHCMEFAPTNQIINVGGGKPLVFRKLIDYAGARLNFSTISKIEPSEFHKVVQVKDMWLDTTKLSGYGFIPSISIWDGLDEYIESLKEI